MIANRQEEILRKICGDHNIEVRLYSNNTGAKMPEDLITLLK